MKKSIITTKLFTFLVTSIVTSFTISFVGTNTFAGQFKFGPGSVPRSARSSYPNEGLYNNAEGSPVIPLINAAQSTLDIEIYTMDDPVVRQAIREAMSRDVKVRIIKDGSPVGASCDVFGTRKQTKPITADCQDQQALAQEVQSAGGVYAPFNKSQLCGPKGPRCFQHGKTVVADRSVAFISSGNLDPTNLCEQNATRCDRDYSFIVSNAQIVNTLDTIFNNDVQGQAYDLGAVLSAAQNTWLTVGQLSLQPLVNFLNSAKHVVRIQNQYITDPTLISTLVNLAKRGVKVFVNVSSPCSFGRPTAREQSVVQGIFTQFDQAGIESRMFTKQQKIDGHPGYLHAKAIIVDDTSAWIGSDNGSTEALTQNREYGIFFTDSAWVKSLYNWMGTDFTSPSSETWQESLTCAKG